MSGARCDTCDGEGAIERPDTPEEVYASYALGIGFYLCPDCGGSGRVPPDTLLGVVSDEYDEQAETGQGPPI